MHDDIDKQLVNDAAPACSDASRRAGGGSRLQRRRATAARERRVALGLARSWQQASNEALKHIVDEAPDKGPLLDGAIITQFQRITHYGIAGFGSAAALAEALGLDNDGAQIKAAVAYMHSADELMSAVAEEAVNQDAADE